MEWSKRYAAGRKRTPTNEMTERAQCGTRYGYDLHRKYDEPSCDKCQKAVNDYATERNRTRGVQEFKPAECGTNAGYAKHRKMNEVACKPCLQAHSDHVFWFSLPMDIRQEIIDGIGE